MKPQEKAKALVEKFYRITASQPIGEKVEYFYHSIEYFEAKQCALVCVDEVYEWLEDGKAEEGFIELGKVEKEITKL